MTRYCGSRQWDGTAEGATPIIDWILEAGGTARYHDDPARMSIDIPGGGTDSANPGDWIVQGAPGSFKSFRPEGYAMWFHQQPETSRLTVYASIGNSDNKLTQQQWHEYWVSFRRQVMNYASQVHGEWLSIGCAPYQNGCICFELPEPAAASLKAELRKVAGQFGQDSIAWAEALTEFLEPGSAA